MNKNEMTIVALREAFKNRIAEITDSYEMRIIELRIEVTELSQMVDRLTAELNQRDEEVNVQEEASDSE